MKILEILFGREITADELTSLKAGTRIRMGNIHARDPRHTNPGVVTADAARTNTAVIRERIRFCDGHAEHATVIVNSGSIKYSGTRIRKRGWLY